MKSIKKLAEETHGFIRTIEASWFSSMDQSYKDVDS